MDFGRCDRLALPCSFDTGRWLGGGFSARQPPAAGSNSARRWRWCQDSQRLVPTQTSCHRLRNSPAAGGDRAATAALALASTTCGRTRLDWPQAPGARAHHHVIRCAAGGAEPGLPRRRHVVLRPFPGGRSGGQRRGRRGGRDGRMPTKCRVAVDAGPGGDRVVAGRPRARRPGATSARGGLGSAPPAWHRERSERVDAAVAAYRVTLDHASEHRGATAALRRSTAGS
jgi:hypothetical protein